jgi:hypothetical protein
MPSASEITAVEVNPRVLDELPYGIAQVLREALHI